MEKRVYKCKAIIIANIPEQEIDNYKCKGVIFKYIENKFFNNRGEMVNTQRFRLLKKKSCQNPNCYECEMRAYKWDVECMGNDFDFTKNVKLENNKLYRLKFVPGGVDVDSWVIDDWWWELEYYNG